MLAYLFPANIKVTLNVGVNMEAIELPLVSHHNSLGQDSLGQEECILVSFIN